MNVFHWVVIYCFWATVSLRDATGQLTALCGHPGAPANGTFTPAGSSFILGTRVRYRCADGYILFGSEDRTCLTNATWSGEIPYCDFNMARGKAATQSGVYQQQRAYLAIDGQMSTCSSTQKTQAERWWQLNLNRATSVATVAITINPGVEADFSVYVVATRGGDDTIVYNRCGNFSGVFEFSMVEVQCNNGSGLAGQYVFIRDNRRGAFHFSLCEVEVFSVRQERPCGQPERPLRSTVQPFNRTAVRYGCKSGFRLNDPTSDHLNCVDGMWESPPPRCVDTYCTAPAPLSYAKFTPGGYAEWFPSPNRSNFPFGTVLNYTCARDHVQAVQGSLVCGDNDTWIGTWPVCLPTTCGPPPIVKNGSVHFWNASAPTAIGAQAELRCHQGFLLSDVDVVFTCLVNGSWSDIIATCEEISNDLYSSQPGLGIILSVVVILILVCVAVFGLIYLRHRGYLTGTLMTKRDHLGSSPAGSDLSATTTSSHPHISSYPNGTKQPHPFVPTSDADTNGDALYDDVWPSEEALVVTDAGGDGDDALYTDAASSCEDLVLGGDTERIYDRPDGGEEDEHVYYSPLDGPSDDTLERSHLPPADGAATRPSPTGSGDPDHIYEPLRQLGAPTLPKKKPVYAQVDLALKKHRRSTDDGQPAAAGVTEGGGDGHDHRQSPEGIVTYTVPVFGAGKGAAPASAVDSAVQRPLPPIPNPKLPRPPVMVDNALYGQNSRKSWAVVADNDLYDGVAVEVTQKQVVK